MPTRKHILRRDTFVVIKKWVRLLVEAVTGYQTGSIYRQYKDVVGSIFPPGDSCDHKAVAIKSFPGNLEMCGKRSLCIQYGWKEVRRCHQGGIKEFKKIIFVARDPMQSIYSQFQRDVTGKVDGVVKELADNIDAEWPERALPKWNWPRSSETTGKTEYTRPWPKVRIGTSSYCDLRIL